MSQTQKYRFEIRTFRGFKHTNVKSCAILAAIAMVEAIQADGHPNTLWWAVITDHETGLKKIITSVDVGETDSTLWLKI